MGGAVAGGDQRGDSGASAEIEEGIAGARRDEIQKQLVLGIIAGYTKSSGGRLWLPSTGVGRSETM